jgi:myosin heavy subunit
MAKLTKVLTVLLLLLSAAAFALGYMLFKKRELLKVRVVAMQDGLNELASYVDGTQAEPSESEYLPRDIATVQHGAVASVEESDYWADYKGHLELTDQSTMKISFNSVAQDPGSTSLEVKKLVSAAEAQYARLNETRVQLKDLREEHENAIEDVNSHKQQLREFLTAYVDIESALSGAEDQLEELQEESERLKNDNLTLEKEVGQKENKIYLLMEEISRKDERIANFEQDQPRGAAPVALARQKVEVGGLVEAGEKGKIVSVNNDWNYMILAINSKFLDEITSLQKRMAENNVVATVPSVDLLVKRGPGYDTFVTKAKLSQFHLNDRLAVLDIDRSYLKYDVQVGDVAFY